MDVPDLGRKVALVLAAMHDGHLVTGAQQLDDEGATDEPRAAEDENPHQVLPSNDPIGSTLAGDRG
jgi:hypothetical protein